MTYGRRPQRPAQGGGEPRPQQEQAEQLSEAGDEGSEQRDGCDQHGVSPFCVSAGDACANVMLVIAFVNAAGEAEPGIEPRVPPRWPVCRITRPARSPSKPCSSRASATGSRSSRPTGLRSRRRCCRCTGAQHDQGCNEYHQGVEPDGTRTPDASWTSVSSAHHRPTAPACLLARQTGHARGQTTCPRTTVTTWTSSQGDLPDEERCPPRPPHQTRTGDPGSSLSSGAGPDPRHSARPSTASPWNHDRAARRVASVRQPTQPMERPTDRPSLHSPQTPRRHSPPTGAPSGSARPATPCGTEDVGHVSYEFELTGDMRFRGAARQGRARTPVRNRTFSAVRRDASPFAARGNRS